MSIRADQRQPNTDVDPSIDFGYRTTAFQLPGFSWRASWRLIMISALLFVVASCIAVVGLTIGDYPLSISEVVNTLVGGGSKFQQMIVLGGAHRSWARWSSADCSGSAGRSSSPCPATRSDHPTSSVSTPVPTPP
ncbi:hypothetical protein ACF3NT_06215 [Naumannella halotolerans]|uniref:hypothetical protein n=1 Tax=Naumannella halotolerans TaxID=993414 RepID=UPI00370D8614